MVKCHLCLHMHPRNVKVRDDKIKWATLAVLVIIDRALVVMIDVMKKMVDPQVLSRRNEAKNET